MASLDNTGLLVAQRAYLPTVTTRLTGWVTKARGVLSTAPGATPESGTALR